MHTGQMSVDQMKVRQMSLEQKSSAQTNAISQANAFKNDWKKWSESHQNIEWSGQLMKLEIKSHRLLQFEQNSQSQKFTKCFFFFGLSRFWTEAQNKESQKWLYSVCWLI